MVCCPRGRVSCWDHGARRASGEGKGKKEVRAYVSSTWPDDEMYFAEDEDEDEADAVGLLGGARDGSGDDMFVGWFGCFWWFR